MEFPVRNEAGPMANEGEGAWFADNSKTPSGSFIGFIATIDPSGVVTYHRVPGNYRVRNVANFTNDDVLFSAENTMPGGSGFVGMMDQTGTIVKEFAVSSGRYPDAISYTSGYIWAALHRSPHSTASDALAQINDRTGLVTEYPTSVIPKALVGGSAQQAVIFTACSTRGCPTGSWEIDQMSISGRLSTIFTAGSTTGLNGLAIGVDGNFWVGDSSTAIDVFVRNPISVDPTSLSLPVGQSGTVTAFSKGSHLFAASSNPHIAIISSVGGDQFTITAVSKGTCVIHFHTARFNAADVEVTVTSAR